MQKFMVIGLALIGFSCGDKNLEDFQKDKVNKDLAKVDAVAGDYAGVLTSAKDSSALGGFKISLSPDTHLADSLSSEEATLQVKVTFQGAFQSQIVAAKTSFDSDLKTFKALLAIAPGTSLTLSGNLSGDALSGQIASSGYAENGGKFELVKGAPTPQSESLRVSTGGLLNGGVQKFLSPVQLQGSNLLGTKPLDVSFSLELERKTTEEQFYNLLVPVKSAQVSFEFKEGESRVPLVFKSAQYDERNGSILGETAIASGSESHRMSLDCRRQAADWKCRITSSSQGEVLNMVFKGGA